VECWVVEDEEGPVGFLSMRVDAAPVARVDLLVLEARARGRGLGPHLLRWGTRTLADMDPVTDSDTAPYTELVYPTQLANTGAIRMCERLGLRFQEALHVLHSHAGGDA
jgi:GNAT superfamily N-acetyltransferase